MFREGSQIGFYTLIRKLGKGGFGEVWLAERKSKFVTTKVAVKLPLDEQVDHEAIKQEAQLWEQASGHPNILPIIDADEYDGQIVIVSEYAPDGSLDQRLKARGKMPFEKAVEMTIKILDGLEFLHSRNIIHRDLKPANILLQNDTPRLADFGISRALRTTALSQSSNVSGTFAYMPPEGFDGKRSVQTDVWSVGVNLYQFLTGALPFPQKEPSALIAAIMMRDFEPLPPDIPNNLQSAIARALAKQPENRYATARDMREDLRRILRGEAISDFIQPDSRQTFPAEQVTQIRKTAPFSTNNSQDENETVARPTPKFEKSNLTKQEQLEKLTDELESISNRRTKESSKSSNIWIYVMFFLLAVIGFGIYFLIKQSQQLDANKNYVNSNIFSNSKAKSESYVNSQTPFSQMTETNTVVGDKGTVKLEAKILTNTGNIQPVSGEKFYLLNQDLESILSDAGVDDETGQGLINAYGLSVLYPDKYIDTNRKATIAIAKHIVYRTQTDASGKGSMKNVKPNTYYLFGITKTRTGFAVWSAPVSIEAGENLLNLAPARLTDIEE